MMELWYHNDSFAQDCGNSSADALELPQSCDKSVITPITTRWEQLNLDIIKIWHAAKFQQQISTL